MQERSKLASIRELPMRYMFGLREIERSSLAESTNSLFADFDAVSDQVLGSLTAVLN